MSSTETSGAPAEGTATPSAPAAEFPSFGTTRGSGLARGKRPSAAAATPASAAPSDYKPTAIEVVNAPREYTNPFAPATPEPAEQPAPAPTEQAIPTPKAETSIPPAHVERFEPAPADASAEPAPEAAPAELNILPPAAQKTTPAQTWESEGFSPARESRRERAPRDEQPEEVDIASIPPQFLYVRPGVKFVPTPRNWGGAPRERHKPAADQPAHTEAAPSRAPRTEASAPAKSGGGLFGWIKSLFGGESAPSEPASSSADSGEHRRDGGHRRHRGGRGGRGGEGGGHRRHRGGRGRGRPHGESEGTRSSGSL